MMVAKFERIQNNSGFTLPEIIIAITVIGILGAMSVQFMASALQGSTKPIDIVKNDALRVSIMERIISDYVLEINRDSYPTALSTMESAINGGDYNEEGTSASAVWIEFDGSGLETVAGSPTDYLKAIVSTDSVELSAILAVTRNSTEDTKVTF